jgi:hypothetical protein
LPVPNQPRLGYRVPEAQSWEGNRMRAVTLTLLVLAGHTGHAAVVRETTAELGPFKQSILPGSMHWPVALDASAVGLLKAGELSATVVDVTDPGTPIEVPASIRIRPDSFDVDRFPAEVIWTLAGPLPKGQVGRHRIVVRRTRRRAKAAPVKSDLVVTKTDKAVTVSNSALRVTHLGPAMHLKVTSKPSGKSFYLIANWSGRAATLPTRASMTFDLYIGPPGKDGRILLEYAASLHHTANAFYDYKIRQLLKEL